MAASVHYTADMVRALPDDGNRYETVHGELLVTPSPKWLHQEVVGRLYIMLYEYWRAHAPHLHVCMSPADISWGPDILVQPDVFVLPKSEVRTQDWARMKSLVLTIEVLSPSTA